MPRVFILFLLSILFLPVSAQDAKRVLVLHDFWEQDLWGLEVDRSFLTQLKLSLGAETQISSQYLGINEIGTLASLARKRQHVKDMILDQGVDLVVTVLPTAGDFYLAMDYDPDVPVIFLIPSFDELPTALESNPFFMVRSPTEISIANTIDAMLKLKPNTQTIAVFIGDNAIDRSYVGRVEQIAASFSDQVEFSYFEHMAPEVLRNTVSNLPEDTLVLALPYSAYSPEQKEGELSFLPDLFSFSPVPIFTFSELNMGAGYVGGNMVDTNLYGAAAATIAYSILTGQSEGLVVGNVATKNMFDWRQVDRWGLSLDRLDAPYDLLRAPSSLWQEYPALSLSVVYLILLLSGLLLFQAFALSRTKRAHAKVAASEKQVRESEAQYRLLASNIRDVIWTWDVTSERFTYCSPSVESLTGYRADEVLNTTFSQVMTPKSFDLALAAVESSGGEPTVLEVELYLKTGGTLWCEIVSQVRLSESGEALELVGVTRDISQRRVAEEEKHKLEQQVKQSQRIDSLGTLAGGIAHDFNNILAVVTGITDLLKLETSNSSKAAGLLDKLMVASEKAKSLVGQILTFSRQSSGEKVVTELSQLLEESLGIIEAGIPKTLTIEQQISAEPLPIIADPTQIEQVIINLLTNASEANEGEAGSISISLNPRVFSNRKECSYGLLAAGSYAELIILDRGVGMDAEHLDKIFEPFYTSKELGNGMGMAIVHGIVMDHAGAIDIRSEQNVGTTVTVYLPITDKESSKVVEVVAEPEENPLKRRIMIIDDQQDLLDMMSMMLEHLGHECIEHCDPRKALDSIGEESGNLDLIITDLSMPEISGMELISYCKEHHPTIPLILSTGYSASLYEKVDKPNKGFTILNKPFKFTDLQEALNDVL